MPARRAPLKETPLDAVVDVCIRTGTNTDSNAVGLLKLRLDTPLAELRSQLVTLAGGIPAADSKRHKKKAQRQRDLGPDLSTPSVAEPREAAPSPQASAAPRLEDEHRLHPFDFTSPFQFVVGGGVLPLSAAQEEQVKVWDVIPTLVLGTPFGPFTFSDKEVSTVCKRVKIPESVLKKHENALRLGVDDDKTRLLPALAVVYVRQGSGKDNIHSENVVIERLLMENNMFGHTQTPSQLATILDVHNGNTRDFMFRTILQESAQEGNVSVVEYLLEFRFIQVESHDWRQQTALHLACERGHFAVVQALLKRDADILAVDCSGQTPLHLAMYKRHDTIVSLLEMKLRQVGTTFDALNELGDKYGYSPCGIFAKWGPDWSATCRSGSLHDIRGLYNSIFFDRNCVTQRDEALWTTSLHEAAQGGNLGVADFLLTEAGFDTSNGCLDMRQRSPLHVACQFGHTDLAYRLLQCKGINPNQPDLNGHTPLQAALYNRRFETALMLCNEATITPNLLDHQHFTPLHLAAVYNQVELAALLVEKHGADPNLRYFAKVNRTENVVSVRPLKERLALRTAALKKRPVKGKSIFSKQKCRKVERVQKVVPVIGESVLSLALRCGPQYNVILSYLLTKDAGKSEYDTDAEVRRLLCFALDTHNFEMALVLLKMMSNPDLSQDDYLLHTYCQKEDAHVIRWLLDRGANVNSVDSEGWTPLSLSARAGDVKGVQFLLDRGASVNLVPGFLHPLFASITHDHRSVTSLLVYNGAELGLSAGGGELGAVHLAAKLGHVETVKSLVGRGADLNLLTKDNKNALWVALETGPRRKISVVRPSMKRTLKYVPHRQTPLVDLPAWMATLAGATRRAAVCNVQEPFVKLVNTYRKEAEAAKVCNTFESTAIHLCERGIDIVRGTSCEPLFFPSLGATAGGEEGMLEFPILSGNDDAVEKVHTGKMLLQEPVLSFDRDRVVGLRFGNISIPAGAQIESACIRFVAYGSYSSDGEWHVHGHAVGDAHPFTKHSHSVSSRPKISGGVTFRPTQWVRDQVYKTADLSSIVQEIVNGEDWSAGNGMSFAITASGERDAYSFDGQSMRAPILCIKLDPDVQLTAQEKLLQGSARNPLEYIHLAASKNYWDAVLAIIKLLRTYNPSVTFTPQGAPLELHAAQLHRVSDDAAAKAQAESEVVCGRDVYSFAAEAGRLDVVHALLGMKIAPRKGVDSAHKGWNAADYAVHSGQLEIAILMLVLGIFPLKEHEGKDTLMQALLTAVNGIWRWEKVEQPQQSRTKTRGRGKKAKSYAFENPTESSKMKSCKSVMVRRENPKTSVLHELCKRGELKLIQKWMDASEFIDPNVIGIYNGDGSGTIKAQSRHHSNGSLLYLACRYASSRVANILIDMGMSGTVYNQCNPLLTAIYRQEKTLMQRLVEDAHVDVNAVGVIPNDGLRCHRTSAKGPTTPLSYACTHLMYDVVAFLLSHGSHTVPDKFVEGDELPGYLFPLHSALLASPTQLAFSGRLAAFLGKEESRQVHATTKICSSLIDNRVGVNALLHDEAYPVPLHPLNLAAKKGYFDVVEKMLEGGASLKMAILASYENLDAAPKQLNIAHFAARNGWAGILKSCVEEAGPLVDGELLYPADANPRALGRTLTEIACRNFRARCVCVLLAAGAFIPDAVTLRRGLPIRGLVQAKWNHIASALRTPRITQESRSPHVSDRGQPDEYYLTNKLLRLTTEVANSRARGSQGGAWGYLHAACARPDLQHMLQLLVEEGLSVDAPYHDPVMGTLSPVFIAIWFNNPAAAQYLLSLDASVEGSSTNPLRSPLVPAIMSKDEDVVRGLVEREVNVNTPYQIFHGRSEVANLTKHTPTLYRQTPSPLRLMYGSHHTIQYVTPMFVACYFGMEGMVYNMFSNGADVTAALTTAVPIQTATKPKMARVKRTKPKMTKGCRESSDVSNLLETGEGTTLKLTCLHAVIEGAPSHPLKITVKRKLETGTPRSAYESYKVREKCDRFIRIAKFLIARGILADATPQFLSLMILLASTKGYWEIAAMILKEGGKSTAIDEGVDGVKDGRFLRECSKEDTSDMFRDIKKIHPLHVAAEHAGRDLFAMFLKRSRKSDISTLRDPMGYTALHCAILVSNIGVVELLINLGVDLEMRAGNRGRTPLHLACRYSGNLTIVTMLLKAGVATNAVDADGYTSLMHAAEMGRGPIVELLVSSDIDIGVTSSQGYTALMVACRRGHTDIALPLLQYWTRKEGLSTRATSVLHCACEGGCLPVIEYVLKNFEGQKIFEKDQWGNTPLFYAFSLGWGAVKRALFRHLSRTKESGPTEDSFVNCSSGKGSVYGWFADAMKIAERIKEKNKNNLQFVSMDMSYGPVTPSLRDATSLLQWSAQCNHAVAAHVLGDHCIVDDCYALHVAAERGFLDLVQILLQLEMSNINTVDKRGRTPLMRAIIAGQHKTVLFLLSRTNPKKLSKTNKDQQSVFHLAAISGGEEIMAHLFSQLKLYKEKTGERSFTSTPLPEDENKENKDSSNVTLNTTTGDKPAENGTENATTVENRFDAYGHTPFEYAMMFGHAHVALRIMYAISHGHLPSSLPVESNFLTACSVLSPSSRVIVYDFFNMAEVANMVGFGPTGNNTMQRLTWPDVRCLGLAQLRKDKWMAQRIQELQSMEYEKKRYKHLVQHLDIKFKLKFDFDSIEALPMRKKLLIMQRLSTSLFFGRFASVDAIKHSLSAVELEFVSKKSQVGIAIDNNGALREKFHISEGSYVVGGDLTEALESHFRSDARQLKMDVEDVLKKLNRRFRPAPNPFLQVMKMAVDWKSLDAPALKHKDKLLAMSAFLKKAMGPLQDVMEQIMRLKSLPDGPYKGQVLPPTTLIWRHALWNERARKFESTVEPKPEELPLLFDVLNGELRVANLTEALRPLTNACQAAKEMALIMAYKDTFLQQVSRDLPDLRFKVETEGDEMVQASAFQTALASIENVLNVMLTFDNKARFARDRYRDKHGNPGRFLEVSSTSKRITFSYLLSNCIKMHLKGIRVLVSNKRESHVKYSNGKFSVCINSLMGETGIPSEKWIHGVLYYSIMEKEMARMRDSMLLTLTETAQRLQCYLPATNLVVDWSSFDCLDLEFKFLAMGVFYHSKGAKVLQQLVSGMSVGWDSKLGGVVRKHVNTVTVLATNTRTSWLHLQPNGQLYYHAALVADYKVRSTGGLLTTQEIASQLMMQLEKFDGSVKSMIDDCKAFSCWGTVSGKNLKFIPAGHGGSFTIYSRNILNRPCPMGGEPWSVKIIPAAPHVIHSPYHNTTATIPPLEPKIADKRNGSYVVNYKAPTVAGRYDIHITLNGSHLPGSPFPLQVLPGAPMVAQTVRITQEGVPFSPEAPPSELVLKRWYKMILATRDQYGNLCRKKLRWVPEVSGPSTVGLSKVKNCGNGQFQVEFRALAHGNFSLETSIDPKTKSAKGVPVAAVTLDPQAFACPKPKKAASAKRQSFKEKTVHDRLYPFITKKKGKQADKKKKRRAPRPAVVV